MSIDKQKLEAAAKFVDDLYDRDLIKDITNRGKLEAALASGKSAYFGIDPTAPLLHIGHYLGLSLVKRFTNNSYPVKILLGELTSRVGDPSQRSKSRTFNPDIDGNSSVIKSFLKRYFRTELENGLVEILSNYKLHNEYLSRSVEHQKDLLNILLEFVTNVCDHIKISSLFSKDFLRDRLQHGLRVSELLYPLLQGWDFLRLYQEHDVLIQIGGSDQWGNITTGIELINKHQSANNDSSNLDENESGYEEHNNNLSIVGFTFPIISDRNGNKIGKSDGNAVSITEQTPFAQNVLYQFFLNSNDDLALDMFRKFSFRDKSEIDDLWHKDVANAKAKLSDEVCDDIFGSLEDSSSEEDEDKSTSFSKRSNMLTHKKLDYNSLKKWYSKYPSDHMIWEGGVLLSLLFKKLDLVSSNSEFRRLCSSGGIYLNGGGIKDEKYIVVEGDIFWKEEESEGVKDGYLLIVKGKKQPGIIRFTVIES